MYRKGFQGWLKHLDFIILNMICINLSYLLAYMVRHGFNNPYGNYLYRNMAVVITLIDVLTAIFFESLKNVLKRGYYKEFSMTLKHVCLVELLFAFYLFSTQEGDAYSRITFYLVGVFYLIISYPAHLMWKSVLKKRMSEGGKRSLLIVTDDSMVDTVVGNIKCNNYEMFHMAGVVVMNRDMEGENIDGVQVVANRQNLFDYVCREWIDEVFINIPEALPYPKELLDKFAEMGIVVHIKLTKSSDLLGKKQFVERLGNYTVLTTSINYATAKQTLIKRALDMIGGLVGCLITAILFVFLAPMIYAQSPGPIFFSQVRVGKNGRKFKMYKFRSMYMDAEERKKELMEQNRVKDGMMFKLDWDPRIIGSKKLPDGTVKKGIGNYIRDLSFDEFPQFFNVLKGDMSLVGTRPPTVDEWEKYELHHRARLATKPGITGMWQISGRSNITNFEDVVKLDTKYISEWSMGLDLKILLKTVLVVFRRDGAM